MKRSLLAVTALLLVVCGGAAAERSALWSVVQACIADNKLTGLPFPCLEVNDGEGAASGFVIIRAPLERSHIIISPTARIVGIEAPSLQSSDAPNFIEDAWKARRYVIDAVSRPLRDLDIGLAVNSRPGRSQDQLHIHVDCLVSKYANEVRRHESSIVEQKWSHLQFPLRQRYYWAIRVNDLAHTNVFALAASLLRASPGRLEDVTLVLIPRAAEGGTNGFYLLADQYTPGPQGKAHGEFLLDHSCAAS